MGMILQYSCTCGLADGTVAFGAGMMDFTTHCSIPSACSTCHKVVEAEYFAPGLTCPSCRSTVTPFTEESDDDFAFGMSWSPEDGVVLCLPVERNKCPACGKRNLTFSDDFLINFD